MIPASLQRHIETLLGATLDRVSRVGGGSINDAARVHFTGRTLFLKWNRGAPEGMFDAEADGLRRLRSAGGLRAPEPHAWRDDEGECPAFLLMEHLGVDNRHAEEGAALGRGLARHHAAQGEHYGLPLDNFIGPLLQPNTQRSDWASFYASERLGVQQERAERGQALDKRALRAVERVRERIHDLLPPNPPKSLLHGDLWSGNIGADERGQPVIFDPAVYYGDREVDLAFTELFGGFPDRFRASYESEWPLQPGHRERRDIYWLYPLLVHANLFGGGYGARVGQIAERYL